MQEASEIGEPEPLLKMESSEIKDPPLMDQIKLEDIETPATPDSSREEASSDSVKTESPKIWKPVLGKLQAKKRLMAFANKFNTMPKVHKLKTKGDKVKRQEKILAIEEIVREENKSRLAAQEARDLNIKNALHARRVREENREGKSEERFSRRSGSSYKKRSDRDRRHSRDRRSRSRSRQRPSRRSSQEDDRYSKSKYKDKKEKSEKNDRDKKDESRHKQDESKHKEDSKTSNKHKKDDFKSEDSKADEKKVEDPKDLKSSANKQSEDLDNTDKEKKQDPTDKSNKRVDSVSESMKELINDGKDEELRNDECKEEYKLESQTSDVKNSDDSVQDRSEKAEKAERIDKHEKLESSKKEDLKSDKSSKEEQKNEPHKRDDVKTDIEKKEESKSERQRKDSKSESGKKEDTKSDKSKRDNAKVESRKSDEIKVDSKREDDRDEPIKIKRDDVTLKRSNSRDNKLDRVDLKDKREEPRIKVHREREREKDKIREMREKELYKCRNWKDFRRYGFFIDDVGYIRRNDISDKMDKPRSPQDYNQYLQQMLMLSDERQHRFAFLAQGQNGPKEYPPETIKSTNTKPSLLYCENPRHPTYLDHQHILSMVSPNRREKMEDICEATQIRIITSEREEGHHERLWYKTMDPSKSISIRTSVDVPSFPRSKWDSENEISDDDDIFEKIPEDIILTKDGVHIDESASESETESQKLLLQVQQQPLPRPTSPQALIKPQPDLQIPSQSEPKADSKELKQTTIEQHVEDPPLKTKSKHKNKSKNNHSPSPKKKDRSPSHKKHKEEKNKHHEKNRSREDKHHHHHHKDKDKKSHADQELKESSDDKFVKAKSATPEEQQKQQSPVKEPGDDKLVSEYEQFMKMVSNSDSKETTETAEPSTFYEFSLEAKLDKEPEELKLDKMPSPVIEKLNDENDKLSNSPSLAKTCRKSTEKEIIDESIKKPEKIVDKTIPEQRSCQQEQIADSDESEVAYESSEADEDSDSVPSDWENVKIKQEKFSDDETSATEARVKVKTGKKRRKRSESWSSDSSSSSSSDSEDDKQSKRRKRRRKRPRKASTSESDSTDSSSSDSSSSEEMRKKKRKKSDKKRKKRKRAKKLSKKLRRKRRRKASTDSSSSDSDVKPPKKRSRKIKAKKKKKNKLSKQQSRNSSDGGEKPKSKSDKNEKHQKAHQNKIKDETKKNMNIQAHVVESEKNPNQKNTTVDEMKLSKSPVISDNRHRDISEETYSEWERESVPRQIAKEAENVEAQEESRSKEDSRKKEKLIEDKSDPSQNSKDHENENEIAKKNFDDSKIEDVVESINNKKKKKDKEVKRDIQQEFKSEWKTENSCQRLAKPTPTTVQEEPQKFGTSGSNVVSTEKKPIIDWNDTDFDSLNVLSLTQLEQVVKKRESIFANEWEVDSLEAIPNSRSTLLSKKDAKKKKDKRTSAIRIWEDEQENAEREELSLCIEKKPCMDNKEKSLSESEAKKNNNKVIETVELNSEEKVRQDLANRRKSRWDVESQSEEFENAPPVMWEVESNIWPDSKLDPLNIIKTEETTFNSPLLEAVSARVKDEVVKVNSSSSLRYTPPKDDDIVDSPQTLRRKMEEIAALERALNADSTIMKNLDELKSFEVKDMLDLEPPKETEIAAAKEQKAEAYLKAKEEASASLSKSKDLASSKRVKDEKPDPLASWDSSSKQPQIDEASEFCIPPLAEIDSKIAGSGSSYRDIFLEIDSINFEKNILNKFNNKQSVEPVLPVEEKPKVMLKLVPKQVLTRQINAVAMANTNIPDVFKTKICDINELPKVTVVDTSKTDDAQSRSMSSKSPTPLSVKRKSPSRKDRESGKRRSIERDNKDKKEYQSRSSRRSPTSNWDNKETIKSGSTSRTASPSRSRSRSRSPRRRDDRSKVPHSKRDKRSPLKSSAYRDNSKKTPQSSKSDRGKRRYDDNFEHDKNRDKPYDPMEILRERNYESEKSRANRRIEEDSSKAWRHSDHSDDKLPVNPYPNEYSYENKGRGWDDCSDRDNKGHSRSSSSGRPRSRERASKSFDRRDRRDSRSPDSLGANTPLSRRDKLPPLRKSPLRSSRRSPLPRSRLRSRSRSRSRSWSRSLTRSKSRSRSRSRSDSRSRFRNNDLRLLDKSRRSRSFSPLRNRYPMDEKAHLEEEIRRIGEGINRPAPILHLSRTVEPSASSCVTPVIDRSRRMDTIIQLTGESQDDMLLPPPPINRTPVPLQEMNEPQSRYRYPNENENEPEYNTYYQGRNLTYPKIADEPTDSPKRLSLDDRLELELGIKKQTPPELSVPTNFNSPAFMPNASGYPHLPPGQHHGHFVRQPPTVLQVGNVLQVVPTEYPPRPSPPATPASQILRIGNVLQVVPTTTIEWTPTPAQQPPTVTVPPQGVRYTPTVPPPPSNASPALLAGASPLPAAVVHMPPIVKPIVPITVPPPQIAAVSPVIAAPIVKLPPPEPVIQPVYNYEAILEARRVEKEERKRLREVKRKEKERRRFERAKRRTEKILGKSKVNPDSSSSSSISASIFGKSGDILAKLSTKDENDINEDDETEESKSPVTPTPTEEAEAETVVAEDEEEDDGDEEDDEEEEPEHEQEPEEQEDEEENEDFEADEENEEENKQLIPKEEEVNVAVIPPPPAKGILILPGFGNLSMTNGILSDLEKFEAEIRDSEEPKPPVDKEEETKASTYLKIFEKVRMKKSVQFADGIKPGEGTSPSGGEGDMPSPPPPTSNLPPDLTLDISKKLRVRKLRKKQKRTKPQKTKKKVKVKIIKLKKPKIAPLPTSILDDSDEMDDRSPPPPPPGSPPPPHLWPSYLSTFAPNAANGAQIGAPTTASTGAASSTSSISVPTLPPAQAPPTPLPLLVPPPPLNYSIQPCSKA